MHQVIILTLKLMLEDLSECNKGQLLIFKIADSCITYERLVAEC